MSLVALAARLAADDSTEEDLPLGQDTIPPSDDELMEEADEGPSQLEIIESTEATDSDVANAARFLDSFQYAATALTALSMALSELEDGPGSQILLRAALDMAKHEAEIV